MTADGMLIKIRMNDRQSEDELRSLYFWLRDEPEVRTHARISLVPEEPETGTMGTAFEILQFVTDTGFQALNFAVAYAAWRASRASKPQVTIEYNNKKIILSANGKDAVDEIIRILK